MTNHQQKPDSSWIVVGGLGVVALILVGLVLLTVQIADSIPSPTALAELITQVFPFKPDTSLPEDVDSRLELIVEQISPEQAETLLAELEGFNDQISRMHSLFRILQLGQVVLALVILTLLALSIQQKRRHDMLLRDYRNLRVQYQKLLGNKRIVDAEINSAREYIEKLEARLGNH